MVDAEGTDISFPTQIGAIIQDGLLAIRKSVVRLINWVINPVGIYL